MAQARLLLDTNIVIDYLAEREPFYQDTRLLMIAGYVGEFELWISSPQVTDLVYILSDGGKQSLLPQTLEQLKGLRTFVNVYAVSEREIDAMLASSWKDPEDVLLFEVALNAKADALITRNQADFESELIKVMDCTEFFDWMSAEKGIDYREIEV